MADLFANTTPYKDTYDKLLAEPVIKAGNSTIVKGVKFVTDGAEQIWDATVNNGSEYLKNVSTYGEFLVKKTGNETKNTIDAGINADKFYSQTIGKNIASFGGDFFSKAQKDDPTSGIGGLSSKLNLSSGIGSSIGSGISGAGKSIGNAVSTATNNAAFSVNKFTASTKEFLEKISKIGEEFDKIIKDTFLSRVFKLKGSEILCIMFCIIISMLPCKVRQQIYEAVQAAKKALALANGVLSSVNAMTKTATEAPLVNGSSIKNTVAGLFGNNKRVDIAKILKTDKEKVKSANSTIEVPPNVKAIIDNVIMILSIIAKGQITLPVGISGDIWDFAKTILYVIQTIVTQMVDEFLTKIVSKVEKDLRKMIPQMCVSNIANSIINKIMKVIWDLKKLLMNYLKGLIGDAGAFGILWKTFGWEFKELLDLLALLEALGLILKNFPDLVMLCGIQPCSESKNNKTLNDIANTIASGNLIPETNEPAAIKPISQLPTRDPNRLPYLKNLDELAKPFIEMTKGAGNTPGVQIIKDITKDKPEDDTFDVIIPFEKINPTGEVIPKDIKRIIVSDDFLEALGPAYTVYTSPDLSDITVVYNYRRICGE